MSARRTDLLVDRLEKVAYDKAKLQLQREAEQAARARAAAQPKGPALIESVEDLARALQDAQSPYVSVRA